MKMAYRLGGVLFLFVLAALTQAQALAAGMIITVVSPKELDRLAAEMRKAGPDKLNTATTEAFEVTRITFGILSRLRQTRPGPSDNEKPGSE